MSFRKPWKIATIEKCDSIFPHYYDLHIIGYIPHKICGQKITVHVDHVKKPAKHCNEGTFCVRVNSNHYIEFDVLSEDVEKIPDFNPFKLYKEYYEYMNTVTYIVLHGIGCRL